MKMKEIELNILYWLWKAKLDKNREMQEHEKIAFKKLSEKYPSESFAIFNRLDLK